MSVATAASPAQNPSTIHRPLRFYSLPFRGNWLKSPVFCYSLLSPPRFPHARQVVCFQRTPHSSKKISRWRIGVFVSGEGVDGRDVPDQLSFDEVLSIAEVLCIAPSAVFSIGCVVGSVLPGAPKMFQVSLGSRIFVWQFFLLVCAVAIGGLIRQRQWQRICRDNSAGVDLIGRIEKVEEDLRSSTTIVRVLSRQLEKLGIRFRVTRKALKEPIAETAALAQKNSEATRALTMQEDILEKELGEIQNVLLAMQEQQQKQLELILAIGKAGKLFESKRNSVTEQDTTKKGNSVPLKNKARQIEIQSGLGTNNDRA